MCCANLCIECIIEIIILLLGEKRKRGQESDRNDSWIKGGLKSLFFIRFF